MFSTVSVCSPHCSKTTDHEISFINLEFHVEMKNYEVHEILIGHNPGNIPLDDMTQGQGH